MEVTNRKPGWSVTFNVLLVLMPIIHQYKFFGLEMMEIFCIISVIAYLIHKTTLLKSTWYVLLYVIFYIVSILFSIINFDGTALEYFLRICRVITVYSCFYVFSPLFIDIRLCILIYTKAVYIITFFTFLQTIAYYVFNFDFYLLIPNMMLNYPIENSDILMRTWHINATINYFRPSTFFLEPALQSIYVLPWISYFLFAEETQKIKPVSIALVMAGIVMTISSLGILCMSVLLMAYAVRRALMGKTNVRRTTLLLFTVALLGIIFALQSESWQRQISFKINSLHNINMSSSFSLRILRGLYCFAQFPFLNKLFGCGHGNVGDFIIANHITTPFDAGNESYMNAASMLFCSVGICGVVFYGIFFINLIRHLSSDFKSVALLWLLIACVADVYDLPMYFFIISLLITRRINSKNYKMYALNSRFI